MKHVTCFVTAIVIIVLCVIGTHIMDFTVPNTLISPNVTYQIHSFMSSFHFAKPTKDDSSSTTPYLVPKPSQNDSFDRLPYQWDKFSRLYGIAHIGISRGILCPIFSAGLGNRIFQFATTFGIAMSKNMTLLINRNTLINKIFDLKVYFTNSNRLSSTFEKRYEKLSATFDQRLMNLSSGKNYCLGTYLQSWKYFYKFDKELRKQLMFRKSIKEASNNIIQTILRTNHIKSRDDVTLIGIHVRRGDMLNNKQGYNVATLEYLEKAVNYFNTKYKNNVFIAASNDMEWTKAHMPKHITVEYIAGSPEVDLATLASCDHTITTVGTFSWWCGWLAGGEVTYFKWPAKPGSPFESRINYEDFFYPHWIGF